MVCGFVFDKAYSYGEFVDVKASFQTIINVIYACPRIWFVVSFFDKAYSLGKVFLWTRNSPKIFTVESR